MKRYFNFINGQFVPPHNNKYLTIINPATEELISEVPDGSVEDVHLAIDAAFAAKKEWSRLPPQEIASYLKKLATLIRSNLDFLASVITEEEGKVLSASAFDARFCAEHMEYAAEWARRLEGETVPGEHRGETVLMFKQPRGVVAGIIPWNLPLGTIGRKVGPALITGNTIIIKPSSNTPNNAFEFAKLVQEAGIPAGVINVVSGRGSIVGKALTLSPKINLISLTGSVESGQEVIRNSAENVTRVSLELGGKTPAIVMDDADIDLAVNCILKSRHFDQSGQVCIAVDRVYAHEEVINEVAEKLVKKFQKIRVGDPTDINTDMGSLISKESLDRISGLVDRARKEGARVLTGGKKPDHLKKGFFYEPTVLFNCRQDQEIMRKEIFGPVITINSFKTLDEAIQMANDCEYGLASAIYTKNIDTIMKAVDELEFGETYINRFTGSEPHAFHTGRKKSGIGGDDGKYGIYEYQQIHVAYLQNQVF